jgi:hypothetical protein
MAALALIGPPPASAAPGEPTWTRSIPNEIDGNAFPGCGKVPQAARSIAKDASGNVFIAGCTEAELDRTHMVVMKVDGATGARLWARNYVSASAVSDEARGIAIDASGDAFVTGRCNRTMCTVKVSGADGALLWRRTHGLQGSEGDDHSGNSVAVDAQGNVVAVGGASLSGFTGKYFVAIKYDTNGNALWSAKHRGASDTAAAAMAVALDASGNAVGTGWTADSSAFGPMVTVKFATGDGSTLWFAEHGNHSGGSRGNAIAVDAAGDALVAGTLALVNGNADIAAIKYVGTTGAVAWSATYAGASGDNDAGNAIALDSSGNAYVVGHSEDSSTFNTTGRNMRTVKFAAATGSVLWSASSNGSITEASDEAYAVAVAPNDDALVTGFYQDGLFSRNGRVIRYGSSSGTVAWTRNVAGTNTLLADYGHGILATPSGDAWVAVSTQDTGTGANIRLLRLAGADGTVTWDTRDVPVVVAGTHGGKDSVAIDAVGHVVAGTTIYLSGGRSAARIVKMNGGTGSESWRRDWQLSPAESATFQRVRADAAGDVYVSATTGSGYAVVKLAAANGAVLWTYTMSSLSLHMDVLPSGGALVVIPEPTGADGIGQRLLFLDPATGSPASKGLLSTHAEDRLTALDFRISEAGLGVIAGRNCRWDVASNCGGGGSTPWAAIVSASGDTAIDHYRPWGSGTSGVFSMAAVRGNRYLAGGSLSVLGSDFGNYLQGGCADNSCSPWWNDTALGGGYTRLTNNMGVVLDVAADSDGNHYDRVTGGLYRITGNSANPGAILWLRGAVAGTVKALELDSAGNPLQAGDGGVTFKLSGSNGDELWRHTLAGSGPGGYRRGAAIAARGDGVAVAGESDEAGMPRGWFVMRLANPVSVTTLAGSAPTTPYGGNVTFTATVTGNAPGGTVTFSRSLWVWPQFQDNDPSVNSYVDIPGCVGVAVSSGVAQCTTSALPVSLSPTSIRALYSGDPANSASASEPVLHQVVKAAQEITFDTPPMRAIADSPFQESATGGGSGNPVTFQSLTTGICTTGGTNDATVTLVSVGNCTLRASQAGNDNYEAATPVDRTFAVVTALHALTVNLGGTGGGSVSSDPAGVSCGTDCGESYIGGTVVTLAATPNGNSIFIGWSGACAGTAACMVTMDAAKSVTATFDAIDTTPNAFSFADVTGVSLLSVQTSNAVTITGINAPSPVSVTGGTYSIGCSGTFTGTAGVISSGQTVCVRHTASANYNTGTHTLLTVGGVSDTFTSTTLCQTGFTGSSCNQCLPGYWGTSCSACPGGGGALACSGHGTCSDGIAGNGTCACAPGYAGSACQYSDAGTCSGHGVAQANGTCVCNAGYAGSSCATAVTAPQPPTNVVATAGNGQATVTFVAPASDGGSPITGYAVASSPAGGVDTNAGTTGLTHVVAGLVNGTSYTFTVKATNAIGASETSAPSNAVTPTAATQLLTVTTSSPGSGSVTSSPAGINCGSACSASFESATSVTLTATAASGSVFAGWSGDCSGTGTCQVTMSQARSVTATFALATAIPRLGNISTRGPVLTGNDVMIGGFIIGGAVAKKVLITARGPSLTAFGVTGALANPKLELYSGQTKIAENDDWQTNPPDVVTDIQATGIAPSNALESALMVTLNPGAYTAIVSGVNDGTGVAIVEVFEQDKPEIPLVNISTRGQVQTVNNVMIGGFIIQGDSPQTVLVTARGPSLAPFGITNPLANPKLEIFSGQTKIFENDDWETQAGGASAVSAIQATGVAPTNSKEAALLVTLNPGAYTAIVSGVGGVIGVGIVEVFAQ